MCNVLIGLCQVKYPEHDPIIQFVANLPSVFFDQSTFHPMFKDLLLADIIHVFQKKQQITIFGCFCIILVEN